jgi:cytochrome o ubiquinol oxidase subunit IV
MQQHGSLKSYTTGFVLSVIFTIIPYALVVRDIISGNVLVAALVGFAFVQLIIQLLFFLHLGRESKPRWNLMIFLFMLLVLLILVLGSLWIMNNLNYNMMSPHETNEYIQEEERINR